MGLYACIANRNAAITVPELSMKCSSTEVPSPVDGVNAERFTGGGTLTGSFIDAVSGDERSLECVGTVALSVSGGRLLGIVAPADGQPSVWFSTALADLHVAVVETGSVRKKPVTVRVSADSVVLVVTAIHRLLKTLQQSGQGQALVDALKSGQAMTPRPSVESARRDVLEPPHPSPSPLPIPRPIEQVETAGAQVEQDTAARKPTWVIGLLAIAVLAAVVIAVVRSGGKEAARSSATATTQAATTLSEVQETVAELPTSSTIDDAVQSLVLPAVAAGDAELTKSYLVSNEMLSTFRDDLLPLTVVGPNETAASLLPVCTEVATALDSINPSALLTAAQGIPDPVLAELFIAARRLTSDGLVACGSGDTDVMKSSLESLRTTDQLIGRRLKELGL